MGINTEVEVEDSSTKFQDANQWRKHKSLTSAVVMVAPAERMGFYLCDYCFSAEWSMKQQLIDGCFNGSAF